MYALFAAGDMKRDAYGEDGPVHKRQRQTDDEVTFLIPSKVTYNGFATIICFSSKKIFVYISLT